MAKKAIRAAGYARVSTAEQAAEGLSLGEQERRIEAFIAAQGWEPAGIFTEAGIPGPIPFAERPAGAKLIERLNGVDRIIVTKFDRLGRGAPNLLSLIEHFEAAGCHVVSLSEGIDTSTSAGRLMRTILAGVAEWEHDRISERVADVTRARAQAGRPSGGPRPYGYRYVDGALVVVPHEAEVVRRIFAEYVGGVTQLQLVRRLRRDGIPTARGGAWHQGTVAAILRNTIYVGRITHKGEEFPGQHDAIIDIETFERACALRDAGARTKGKGRGRRPAGRHLFYGGTLRCGECGEALVPRTAQNRRSDPYEVYQCYGRKTEARCEMPVMRRADIDGAVYAYFEQVGLDLEATREAIAEARQRKLGEVRALLEEAERETNVAEERLARVRRDYTDGRLPAEDWVDLNTELAAERRAARLEAQRLATQHRAAEQCAELADLETETLHRLAEIRGAIVAEVQTAHGVEAVHAALSRLFEAFVVHRTESPRAPHRFHAELALIGDYVIEPVVREQAIEGYSENVFPVLRREALCDAEPDNYAVGLTM